MDWQKHFKEASMRGEESAAPTAPPSLWERSGLSKWGIGEWGSVASMAGILFWMFDKAVQCTPRKVTRKRG